VFTHPLYRARGLATAEISSAMNRLVNEGKGVSRLTVLKPETNDVVKRLLDKMGFAQDRKLVEMSSRI
jgi:predicted GNAT family acetyltransferase